MEHRTAVGLRSQHAMMVNRGLDSPFDEASLMEKLGWGLMVLLWLVGHLAQSIVMLPMRVLAHGQTIRANLKLLGGSLVETLPWQAAHPEARMYRWRNLRHAWKGVPAIFFGILIGSRKNYGVLRLMLHRGSELIDLGVVSHQLITTAGVNKLVAGLIGSDTTTFSLFKFLGFGTGATAPAIGDTALGTEYTTQYATANTRPTATQSVGATNNVYRVTGTFSPSSNVSPTETGLLSQAATGGGTLLDRFTYTAVPLTGGADSLAPTIDITLPAGS